MKSDIRPLEHAHARQSDAAPSAVDAGSQAVTQQYEQWATRYDADTASYGWNAPQTLLTALLARTPAHAAQRVLDIGVGTGQASLPFLDARAQVIGLDIAPAMLAEARRKHPGFHHLGEHDINAPLQRAGIKNESIDVIVCVGAIHFARDLGATLRDAATKLAPGGALAFTYIPEQDRQFGTNTHRHAPSSVEALLQASELAVEQHESFVAYYDRGNQADPVRYALVIARKPGATAALPDDIDRTACVDRDRVRTLMQTPPMSATCSAPAVRDNDPALASQLRSLRQLVETKGAANIEAALASMVLPQTAYAPPSTQPGCEALCVFAHPDDESIYAGATIAALSARGKSVALAIATGGAGGRPTSSGESLATVRRNELLAAAKVLGISDVDQFGFADTGKYADTQRAEPMTAAQALDAWGFAALVEAMVRAIRTRRPRTVVSFDSTRDPNYSLHGHHLAVGTAATIAFHLAADPEAFVERGLPPWSVSEQLAVVPRGTLGARLREAVAPAAAKLAAVAAHPSQTFSTQGLHQSLRGAQVAREHLHLVQSRAHDLRYATKTPPLLSRRNSDPSVAQLYRSLPTAQVHQDLMARHYPRAALSAELVRHAIARGASTTSIANAQKLAEPSSVCVVSGQQVGVLGGPAYTLYKALGAVHHAAELRAQGIDAVPVFWLASYDHDFAEIATVYTAPTAANPDGKEVMLAERSADKGKAVGSRALGQDVTRILQELEASLPETANKARAMALVRSAYTASSTTAEAFAKLLGALTDEYGLVLLDPSTPEFASLAAPVIAQELFGEARSADAIAEANCELERLCLSPTVQPIEDATQTNVFFKDDDGKRVAIYRRGADFATAGTPSALTATRVKELLVRTPQRFTPSALLRPVVQDSVLPTMAYVAGPSEAQYFAQIGGVYDWAGVPMPSVVQRPSFAIASHRDFAALQATADVSAVLEGAGATVTTPVSPAEQAWHGLTCQAYTLYAEIREAITRREYGTVEQRVQVLRTLLTTIGKEAKSLFSTGEFMRMKRQLDDVESVIAHNLQAFDASLQDARRDAGKMPAARHLIAPLRAVNALRRGAARIQGKRVLDARVAAKRLMPRGKPQERQLSLAAVAASLSNADLSRMAALAKTESATATLMVVGAP